MTERIRVRCTVVETITYVREFSAESWTEKIENRAIEWTNVGLKQGCSMRILSRTLSEVHAEPIPYGPFFEGKMRDVKR